MKIFVYGFMPAKYSWMRQIKMIKLLDGGSKLYLTTC